MRKARLAIFVSLLSFAAAGYAQIQEPSTEIRESTDPAKVADVEQRAMEIQSRQQQAMDSSGESGATTKKAGKRSHAKKSMTKSRRAGEAAGSSGASSSQGGGESGQPAEGESK